MARGIKSGQTRAGGETAATEEAVEEAQEALEPMTQELPEERERKFRHPGFSRMRMSWSSEDRPIIQQARAAVDGRILENFADAYQVMHEVYEAVRTPVVDEETGLVAKDQFGFTVWKQTVSGSYEEDWSRLSHRQRENLLFTITTRLFDWEQRAADAWGEAMFAKAIFEERFAMGFDAPMSGTVDDRRAAGNLDARDERYFAIFLTLYSRKADAVVKTLALLGQRLKDAMQA